MQIQTALEGDLPGPEFAHLALLDAITRPMEVVLGSHIDDELIGQTVDLLRFDLLHGCLAAAGDLSPVALAHAGVGAIIPTQRFDAESGGLEQGEIVIGHGLTSMRGT
ncbi:hypothetical protein GCM10017624_37610 [Azotobacter vinelandii]|nr:hypothetical protein GCM10017624_37610 [Azotobacter vinelandii]